MKKFFASFSTDEICFALALLLTALPLFFCISEWRPPTPAEWVSIVLGVALATVTYQSSNQTSEEIKSMNRRVRNFSVSVIVDFSWPSSQNPLLDNQNDHSSDTNEFFWLNSSSETIGLESSQGYKITRTGPNSATFACIFTPKKGEILGRDSQFLYEFGNCTIHFLLKNYWTNGRDSYQVVILNSKMEFTLNEQKRTFAIKTPTSATPSKVHDYIWGLITVSNAIDWA